VAHDGKNLLIACSNPVRKGTVLTRHSWGNDAMEIAFRLDLGTKTGAITVLRGYPDGHFSVQRAANGKARPRPAKADGVRYAANVVKPTLWTAEWRIPLAAFGIDPAANPILQFNLTVRKAAQNLWQMWESTRGNSYDINQAGSLRLEP
jgi:hypothetical protein